MRSATTSTGSRRASSRRTAASSSATTWCRPTPPTTAPTSSRSARPSPDFVYLNLAGVDQTTFLKQYKEYGLPSRSPAASWIRCRSGPPAWTRSPATGRASGTTGSTTPASQAFTKQFIDKLRQAARTTRPGATTSACKILLQAIAETEGTDAATIVEYLEKGAELRHPEGAQGQVPRLGPPAPAGDVRGQGQGPGAVEGQVGHLRDRRAVARRRRIARADPADAGRESLQHGVMQRGRGPRAPLPRSLPRDA